MATAIIFPRKLERLACGSDAQVLDEAEKE
jgi:hypothetical protein